MKQCPFCANVLNDNDEFCNNCGNKVSDTADVSKQPQDAKKKKESKGSKTALIIIIAILAVLLIGAVTVFVLDVTGAVDISAIFSGEEKITQTQISMGEETSFEENTEDVTYGEADEPLDSGADGYFSTINVGTGGFGGTYYAFSCAAGNTLSNDDYKFNVVSTDGSKSNILGINDGNYQMAICSGDVMNYAYNGENGFDSPVRGFSAIGCIYPEICQIITTEDSGIYSISDLRGKNVAIGDVGSGVYYNAVQILEAAGIDPENDINTVYSSFGDSVISLKDGSIDAAFITAGVPTTAVTELATSTKTVALSLPEDVIEELIRKYPYYTEYTLTNEDYDFITSPVSTVCIKAAYIVTNDMSEQQVYEITKALWEDPDVRTSHVKAEEMDIYTTLAGIGSVPLHPGAERYYKEKGIIKNTSSDTSSDITIPEETTDSNDEEILQIYPGTASYQIGTYLVNVGNNATLTLREEAAKDSDAIRTIPNGTMLTISEIATDPAAEDNMKYWGKTEYLGYEGWVAMEYLEEVSF